MGYENKWKDLVTFGVFLVEGPDVKSISCVDLAPGGYQRRRVPLLVDLRPVVAGEERVVLQLVGPASAAA